uniref:DUF4351 domain-containing protein n=1 Tax=Candidatus Kentrum sp. FW TaxID=2126338 RepID=A0A450T9T6_9GAMM|nr:MAG: protein of unknown function (DUF4351) [Candidatus Kentron sp. FW]
MEEAEKVLTQIDMTRIPAYRLGMEKGRQEGRQEGLEKGEAMFLARQLSHKFGTLSPLVAQHINNARPEELATWGERVLSAKSLDEVFS